MLLMQIKDLRAPYYRYKSPTLMQQVCTEYRPPGAIICCEGPPTPRAGPCKPGAPEAPGPAIPRPAARPIPCPGAAPANGTLATPS